MICHRRDRKSRWPAGRLIGVWRSLVARFVRDEEVVGSNPATPTLDGAGAAAPAPSFSRRFPEEAR